MRFKTSLGWIIIFIVTLIPLFLLIYSGESLDGSLSHVLGEVFGLIAMTLFAITFVLSTRIKFIENAFDGLDKVYIVHAIIGGTALIATLFHPIFLVLKFIPNNIWQASLYLLPSKVWSVNFGIIALLGMMFLIGITLFTKMKYHKWKFSHEFLGLVFLFAVIHTFMVRGTVSNGKIFEGYYIYAIIITIIGTFSFLYSLFLKNRIFKVATYTIKSISKFKNCFEITMIPEHKPLQYKSGQFIFVRFYNKELSKEYHPFSIASKSNSNELKIIVKKLGDFTNKLEELRIGDRVSIEGPYGKFNYKKSNSDQVWIAAGIGIVPFLGMAEDLLEDKTLSNNVTLIYSIRNESDLIGSNFLKEVESKIKNFKLIIWVSSLKGHIDMNSIYELSGEFKGKSFFLCGPPKFKNAIIKGLCNHQVKDKDIYEEVFDLI